MSAVPSSVASRPYDAAAVRAQFPIFERRINGRWQLIATDTCEPLFLSDRDLGSGLNRHPPRECRGDKNGRQEVVCLFIVSRCDASEVFESTEHSFDQISASVGDWIVGGRMFSCRVWRNDSFATTLSQPVA